MGPDRHRSLDPASEMAIPLWFQRRAAERDEPNARAGVAGVAYMFPEGGAAPTSAPGQVDGTALNRNREVTPGWLFVLPWSLKETGGVNEVVKNLVRRFQAGAAFAPHVLISSETADPDTRDLGIGHVHCLNLWPPVDQRHPVKALLSFVFRFYGRCRKIMRIVKQLNITVINLHFPGLEALNLVLMRKMGLLRGKLILSFHLSDVRGALSSGGIGRLLWRLLVRCADHIVVVSNDLGKEVLELEPRAARTLRTIYNGVDLDLFAAARDAHENERQCADGRPVILGVGNFIPRKGHDVLLRAFVHVVARVPGAHLTLVGGNGPEFARTQDLVASMGLSAKVSVFKDVPHERIPRYFSKATLFALASRSESFGLVVTEAAASKVPVVCTRVSGLRELITDGVTGRLVDVDDSRALAVAIVDLLSNPEEARRLADNLYEEVKVKFTWQKAYESYLELAGP